MTTERTLDMTAAVAYCFFFSIFYVGGFYLFPSGRNPQASRNDANTIKERFASVGLSSLITLVICNQLTFYYTTSTPNSRWAYLGLRVPGFLTACWLPLLLTAALFLGPLVNLAVDGELPLQSNFSWTRDFWRPMTSLVGMRTYIVGPVSEEIVFRAGIILPLYLAGASVTTLVFLSPLFFGCAHVHHAWEHYRQLKIANASNIALRIGFTLGLQLTYTTLFGWYASFLLLRTDHLIAPIVCHAFCNLMGFPDFQQAWSHPTSKAAISLGYLGGLAVFSLQLFPWTEPSLYANKLLWS